MVLMPMSRQELGEIFTKRAIMIIQYFLDKAVFAQPEPMPRQKPLPFQAPQEHIEQWLVHALNVRHIGSGSSAVDIFKAGEWGADVKMMSCKMDEETSSVIDADSGETSLAQKFSGTGNDLDTLFRTKEFAKICNGWKAILSEKLKSVLDDTDKNIRTVYYFVVLRAGSSLHLCGLKIDPAAIDRVEVSNSTIEYAENNPGKETNSIWLDGMIDKRYGNVKIYKAKKRMELRLRPINWINDGLTIEFKMKSAPCETAISELTEEQLRSHIKTRLADCFHVLSDQTKEEL